MPSDDALDPSLTRGLGSAAPALREWGLQKNISYRLDRWLTHGRSTALVALVYETDHHEGSSRKLLLKLDTVPDEAIGSAEYRRQRDALRDAPPQFARDHLAELAQPGHDLVRIGDGRWIVFQTVAAGDADELGELDLLTKLLASVRAGAAVQVAGSFTDETIECDGDTFAGLCGQVVAAVLRDWAVAPQLRPMSVADYLGLHLGHRMQAGQPLHELATALSASRLRFPDEYETLPNPFLMIRSDGPAARLGVPAVLGKSHGDLHTGNILVPFRAITVPSSFRLIDLAKYDPMGPLARDPVYLLLYIGLRVLPDLTEAERTALRHVLVDPQSDRAPLLPGWLRQLIPAIAQPAEAWILQFRLRPEWRRQQQLSLLACALVFLGRASTRPADRPWLLHLAAGAAAAFLGPDDQPDAAEIMPVTEATFARFGRVTERTPVSQPWVAKFCEFLPYMQPRARQRGRTADLEALATAARSGADRTDDYIELVRVLGGPTDDLRSPADLDPPTDEVYTCPRQPACTRVEHRAPGEREPRCALSSGSMLREFW